MNQISNILLPAEGGRNMLLDVAFMENGCPKPLVVFCHGFKGFKDWGPWPLLDAYFARAGFVFVRFNFSHNGTTEACPTEFVDLEAFGHNTVGRELDDLCRVLDYLLHHSSPVPRMEIHHDKVCLLGHSRGGGTALLRAAEDKRVWKVATLAAISHFDRFSPETIAEWRTKGVIYVENARTKQQMPLYFDQVKEMTANPARYDLPARTRELPIPVLLVHGTADTSVPVTEGRALHNWLPDSRLIEMEGVDHAFGGTQPWKHKQLPEPLQTALRDIVSFLEKE